MKNTNKHMILNEKMFDEMAASEKNGGGSYRLHCLASELPESEFMAVQRILGADCEGVLYIGAAKHFGARLAELRKALKIAFGKGQAVTTRHKTIRTLFEKSSGLREKFPYERLCVTLTVTEANSFVAENNEIDDYVRRFGEPPPFNSMGRLGVK